jgi:hypothetical protein
MKQTLILRSTAGFGSVSSGRFPNSSSYKLRTSRWRGRLAGCCEGTQVVATLFSRSSNNRAEDQYHSEAWKRARDRSSV